ncbi:MAG: hypothetical protein LIO87_09200 [Eubacterium sp.]|nr:hypothetical protein [Eubacterium sp.]
MAYKFRKILSIQEERELAVKTANCFECESKQGCKFKHKKSRLPGELFPEGLDFCPKIRNERW